MASSASTISNSSDVAPRGLKKLTMKLRAKLEKAKGRVHKKKASANTGEAVIEPNLANEQVQIVIVEPVVVEPKCDANESIVTGIKPLATKEEVLAITADPKPLKEQDQVTIIKSKVTPPKITKEDSQAVVTKQQDPDIVVQPMLAEEEVQGISATPNHTKEQGQNIIMNLKPAEESSQKVNNPDTHQKPSKKEKAEKRAARKEARKVKWATRRAAFKDKAHKVGEALFIPVAVVCGIVFGPLILAFDVCLCAFKAVVWLVVKIVDCLSAPFVACFYFCR